MRSMPASNLFVAAWIGWGASWLLASRWSARTEKHAVSWEVSAYRILAAFGGFMIWDRTARALHMHPLWDVGRDGGYLFAALTVGGIAFAWWARVHLGRLWSGAVERKQDHRIVDSGPYALVRHPIYTGLIAATLATAAAEATAPALAGWALIAFGLWLKARAEERFLGDELGADYAAYRRRVPMLVPFSSAGG